MKNLLILLVTIFTVAKANAQITPFPSISFEGGISGFAKYKVGAPLPSVSASYPYVEYNDINNLTTHYQAELGIIYIPYGKENDFGFKLALSIGQDKIKHAYLSGDDRVFKTTILNYGIKLYPFANNKNFALGVGYNDTEEGKKFYGAFVSGFFLEFGNSLSNSSFERRMYAPAQYETIKTKVETFAWGESLAVFSGKTTTLGIEASVHKYKFDLGGGNQGKKQIKNIHLGLWVSFKLLGKRE